MNTLILTDIQCDFLPGGALAVPHAHEIVPLINSLMLKFPCVIATQDWHPRHHSSFASTHHKAVGEVIDGQILWPDHCIQNTPGADFPPELHRDRIEAIFHKGVDSHVDSYSAFFDNERKRSTGLAEYLKKRPLSKLYFVGLATDYCVLYSVLDALDLGFKATVIKDACRAIDLRPGDGSRAFKAMQSCGASLITSHEI